MSEPASNTPHDDHDSDNSLLDDTVIVISGDEGEITIEEKNIKQRTPEANTADLLAGIPGSATTSRRSTRTAGATRTAKSLSEQFEDAVSEAKSEVERQ